MSAVDPQMFLPNLLNFSMTEWLIIYTVINMLPNQLI